MTEHTEEDEGVGGYEFVPHHLQVWKKIKVTPSTLHAAHGLGFLACDGCARVIEAFEHVWYFRIFYIGALVLMVIGYYYWREV